MPDISPIVAKVVANAQGVQEGMDRAVGLLKSGGAQMAAAAQQAGEAAAARMKGAMAQVGTGGTPGVGGAVAAGLVAGLTAAAVPMVAAAAEKIGYGLIHIPDRIEGAFRSLGQAAAWLGGMLEKAFASPADALVQLVGDVGKLADQIPLVGGLLGLPFEGLASAASKAITLYREGADKIRETGAAAKRVGIDIGEYNVLSRVLGGAEAGEGALFHFRRSLAEAQFAAAGTRTAFSKLGLDGRALAEEFNANPTVAFGRFADALKGVADSTLSAEIAQEVLGRGARGLGEGIDKGSAGIEKMRGLVEKFGLAMGPQDFASIKQLDIAMKQLSMVKEGFTNQIAVAFAPVLAEIADRLTAMLPSAKGLASALTDGLREGSVWVAKVYDNFAGWKPLFGELMDAWDELYAKLLKGMAGIADKAQETWKKLNAEAHKGIVAAVPAVGGAVAGASAPLTGGGGLIGSQIGIAWETGEKIGQALHDALYGPSAAGKAAALDTGFIGPMAPKTWGDQLTDAADKILEDVEKRKAAKKQAGDTQDMLDLGKRFGSFLAGQFGAGTGGPGGATGWVEDLWKAVGSKSAAGAAKAGEAAAKAFRSKVEEGMARLEVALRTPLQDFTNKMKDALQIQEDAARAFPAGGPKLDRAGLLGDLAAGKAVQALFDSYKMPAMHVGAMEAGGREAYSTILANQGEAHMGVQERIEAIMKQQKALEEQQVKLGKEGAAALKNIDKKFGGARGI